MKNKRSKKDQSYGIVPLLKTENDYKLLLVQHISGKWSFPKGHPESGESEIETARRELFEETGLENAKLFEGAIFEEKYYFMIENVLIHKFVKYFLGIVTVTEVKIQESEIQDYAWVTFKEALNKISFKEGKRIIKEVKKYLLEKDSQEFFN